MNGVNVKKMHFNIDNQQKNHHHKKKIEKDLVLFIIYELVLLFFGEFPFLRRLVLRQNPYTRFPSSLLNAWEFAKVGWNDERKIHCITFSILWHLCSQFWQVMDVERRNQHFCFDYSFLNPKLGWHTPKFFYELNHESKDENIERKRNWGTFLGS